MGCSSNNVEKFNNYEAFVEKFKPKKTTDDCYTPPAVFEAVLAWVNDNVMPLDGVDILRPFYPGGDYERFQYPANAVVIDNPPFSILSKIRKFFSDRGIKYFLFAPGLTLFSSPLPDETFIVVGAPVIYDNGAKVPTSFCTNMYPGNVRISIRGDLTSVINNANKSAPKQIRKLGYPVHLITSATLDRLAKRGIMWNIQSSDVAFVRKLDNMRGVFMEAVS